MARHVDHPVQLLSSAEYDKLSRTEPIDEYKDVDDELRADWAKD